MNPQITRPQIVKTQIVSFLLFAGLGSLVPALAQTTLLPQAQPFAANPGYQPTVSPSYRIAPGDVISVTVIDFPSNSVPQTVVAPDGTIAMSLVGEVAVAGRTVGQTTALLTKKWKKFIVDPSVSVSLVQKHPETIVFAGSVMRPGVLEYRPGMHLMEALAESGGAITTATAGPAGSSLPIADPAHVVVTHSDGTRQTLDLTDPKSEAGTGMDIAMVPGDVVYVPEQDGKVNIIGEVKQPSVLSYRSNLTITEAIADCGSFNPDTADLFNARLTHNGKDSVVNLDPLLRKGVMADNITLSPGDRLVIPELQNKTFVFGDVNRPGYYLYKPGDRIQNALSGVAGPTGQADLGKINVIHTDKVTGAQRMVRVNFNDFVLRGKSEGNPLIQQGDSLYIPDKKHPLSLGDVFGGLSGIGSAAYGANTLRGR